jgi:hypothetical protein
MNPNKKAALYVGGGALALLLACCGGLTLIGALADDPQQADRAADDRTAAAAAPATSAASTGDLTAVDPPAAPTTAPPIVQTRTVEETRSIPFRTRTVNDSTLARGTRKVRTQGVPGVKTLTYEVTLTDGVETGRRLIGEKVNRKPITKVVAVGTKTAAPRCDPNYGEGCVPIARDVDCAGGSGDGPAYVDEVVKVIGDDIYDLDRDNDGYGCDP